MTIYNSHYLRHTVAFQSVPHDAGSGESVVESGNKVLPHKRWLTNSSVDFYEGSTEKLKFYLGGLRGRIRLFDIFPIDIFISPG